MLNKPLPHAARQRAFELLTRIRKATIFEPESPRGESFTWPILDPGSPRKADFVWSILEACLDRSGPLLPYLRHLVIGPACGARMDCVAPLISPTLKILKIHSPADGLLLPLLDLGKTRGCDLKVLIYRGYLYPRALEAITIFKDLQDVGMALCRKHGPPTTTIAKFLAALPSLRELTCDLAIFRPCATEETFCHTNLQRIYISSLAVDLQEFFRRCSFPSALDVMIREMHITPIHTSYQAFEGLDTSFPNVQKLDLHVAVRWSLQHTLPLDFKHIAPLLSLPMREFTLISSEQLNLTLSDLRTISESWPNLHSFSLFVPNNLGLCALPSLIAFSNHPHLNFLNLGFSPHFLLNDITEVLDLMTTHAPTSSPRSELFKLCFSRSGFPEQIPDVTKAEKRSLVEFLLLMFPGLKKLIFITGIGDLENPSFQKLGVELEEILLELRIEREIP